MRKFVLGVLLVFAVFGAAAQDTLRVLHYNLLYYGINVSVCISTNNNIDLKDQYLTTIINFTRPDIFTVNELGRGSSTNPTANATRILDNVLNTQGRTHFSAAGFTNVRGSDIVNMLYYNHHKFTLHSQDVITSITRDINLYRLYINNMPRLAQGDTTFIIAIVAHFKAGSTNDDLTRRANEAAAVMAYIDNRNIRGNVMFLADFNMKNAYEQAFQTITQYHTAVYRFIDPIDVSGNWFNNPDVAQYHSQSTRVSSTNTCFIGGGLDDRFDMILLSRALFQGDQGLIYRQGSFRVIGQDGIRLNGELITPTNSSAPAGVIHALYNMSDHLPVELQLITRPVALSDGLSKLPVPDLQISNPVRNYLLLRSPLTAYNARLSVFSLQGMLLLAIDGINIASGDNHFHEVSLLSPGMYIIRIEMPGMAPVSLKFVKL